VLAAGRQKKKKTYITFPVFTVGDPKQHESSMMQKGLIKPTGTLTGMMHWEVEV
jgi:hypothetical protein